MGYDLFRKLELNEEERKKQEIKKFFFKKRFNRFYDTDIMLSQQLKILIDELGLKEVEIMISNGINRKLGTMLK